MRNIYRMLEAEGYIPRGVIPERGITQRIEDLLTRVGNILTLMSEYITSGNPIRVSEWELIGKVKLESMYPSLEARFNELDNIGFSKTPELRKAFERLKGLVEIV